MCSARTQTCFHSTRPYEIDENESKHALSLDEYRHAQEEAPNTWVLLEEAK